ncbi:LysR family transcriptional regulator [Mangrovactinospora gilvigrisea]|uniref:LysR family transcriptional regulator n=1 Tax=Mangrovactinospora gilvigrisea TaxID=1428644 RepID=A0A1J7BJ38_9ACTN|nr:LysR family transcriptional regulator [Mangrovactinospora gilvigrisea]OIV38691.1 LysR family transcriptional regulator [Mangrovactinospora gilvigrisea]
MIDARRLRTLRAVADHGTVTAAAAVLYLTPSAVSQQLNQLENETGERLLERSGRGVALTPAGEILLKHADLVLAQLERADAELAAYRTGAAGTVTVAAFATGITRLVAPAIARLDPGVRVRVRDAEGDESLRLLLDGELDIAVAVEYRGAPRQGDGRLASFPLYAEPFDAVLPRDHPAADQDVLALADLANDPWIGPYPRNPLHEVTTRACERAGFEPAVVHWSDDFSAVVALAAAGAGVALVPRTALPARPPVSPHHPSEEALRPPALEGVVVRPLEGPAPTRRVFAATRAGRENHPLVKAVLTALGEVAP